MGQGGIEKTKTRLIFFYAESEGNLTYVDRCEKLLLEMSNLFHCHHFLVMRIKSQLISQYGNVPGYLYKDLSTEQILRKIELCKEFIQVFDKIDPGGFTDWWAATTYEQVQVILKWALSTAVR